MPGYTLGLYGGTGSGKTTQIGEEAKRLFAETGKRTLLLPIDDGGYDAIEHLTGPEGIIDLDPLGDANPWVWIQEKVLNAPDPDRYALIAYDSATGMGDTLLKNAAQLAAKGIKVGSEGAYSLKVPGTDITIGSNNKSQYGMIQTFMLDQIGRAARLAFSTGINVLWTFGEYLPEVGEPPIIGPKLVGRALTTQLPRHIRYTLRMVSVPQLEGPATHRLLTQKQLEPDGVTSCLVNARFPLGSSIELPPSIEPASLATFWDLVQRAKEEARLMR